MSYEDYRCVRNFGVLSVADEEFFGGIRRWLD